MSTDKDIEAIDRTEAADPVYPEQELTGKVLESAFTVHNALGVGFLERVYSNALALELRRNRIDCVQEAPLKVTYRDTIVGDYVADILVERRVLIEMKACAALDPNHSAQIINYLRASNIHVGLFAELRPAQIRISAFHILSTTRAKPQMNSDKNIEAIDKTGGAHSGASLFCIICVYLCSSVDKKDRE